MMADSCTIRRPTGNELDEDTGQVVPTFAPVYAGRCKVQTYEPYESAPDVAGQTRVIQRYSIHVPVGTGPYEVGDVITLASGRVHRVAGLHEKTWQTAIRLLVDEDVSGG